MLSNNNFSLSSHAKEEMARRQITMARVESIMLAPEQILPSTNGRIIYQSRVVEESKTFLVRIVVEDWHHPPIIVTVYRTSKIEKYLREL